MDRAGACAAAFLLETKLAAAALVSRRIRKRNHLGRGRANRRERRGEGPSGHAVGADQPPDAMRFWAGALWPDWCSIAAGWSNPPMKWQRPARRAREAAARSLAGHPAAKAALALLHRRAAGGRYQGMVRAVDHGAGAGSRTAQSTCRSGGGTTTKHLWRPGRRTRSRSGPRHTALGEARSAAVESKRKEKEAARPP